MTIAISTTHPIRPRVDATIREFNADPERTVHAALVYSQGQIALIKFNVLNGGVTVLVRDNDHYTWNIIQAALENNDIARAEGYEDVAAPDMDVIETCMEGDMEFRHYFWPE